MRAGVGFCWHNTTVHFCSRSRNWFPTRIIRISRDIIHVLLLLLLVHAISGALLNKASFSIPPS